MDEKIFNLLEKMYVDLSGKIDSLNGKIDSVNQDLSGKIDNVRQDITRLEHKEDENHKALYDGYKQNSERIEELNIKVDKLTEQVEHQEIKLQVIKGSK